MEFHSIQWAQTCKTLAAFSHCPSCTHASIINIRSSSFNGASRRESNNFCAVWRASSKSLCYRNRVNVYYQVKQWDNTYIGRPRKVIDDNFNKWTKAATFCHGIILLLEMTLLLHNLLSKDCVPLALKSTISSSSIRYLAWQDQIFSASRIWSAFTALQSKIPC